jgi:hypothetical protein
MATGLRNRFQQVGAKLVRDLLELTTGQHAQLIGAVDGVK